MFVKHAYLHQFVLLLQQNPQQMPAEKAGSPCDQIDETPPVFRHVCTSVEQLSLNVRLTSDLPLLSMTTETEACCEALQPIGDSIDSQ